MLSKSHETIHLRCEKLAIMFTVRVALDELIWFRSSEASREDGEERSSLSLELVDTAGHNRRKVGRTIPPTTHQDIR
jgi:hypothetical protein